MSSVKTTSLQMKEINEVLRRLGMGDKEMKVYLKLLTLKPTTLTPIARSVQLPITTLQAVLTRLVDFGVVNISKHRSRHVYEANDPSILKQLMEQKATEAGSVIPFLKLLQGEGDSQSKIRIFYRERMNDIFLEALAAKQKIIYEIVAAKELQDILGERFHFTKRRIEKKIFLKSLRVENREIKKYSRSTHTRELREAKFLPREITFHASILFWDNSIAFFTSREEGLAFVVESRLMRQMMEQIFQLLWSLSRSMETATEEK